MLINLSGCEAIAMPSGEIGEGGGIADGHLLGVLGEVFICVGSRQYLAIHESYNYISTEEVFVGVYQI